MTYQGNKRAVSAEGRVAELGQFTSRWLQSSLDFTELTFAVVHLPSEAGKGEARGKPKPS